MAGDAVARVRAALVTHGRKIEGRKADDFMAQCPAHGEKSPSLHVKQGDSGALLHCFGSECSVGAIVSALGLTMDDLFDAPRASGTSRTPRYHKDSYAPERPVPPAFTAPDEPADDDALPWAPAAPAGGDTSGTHAPRRADAVAEYPYCDETGTLRVVVVRTAAKGFPCYVPATGAWSLGDADARAALAAIPYNLPALAGEGGVRGRTLFVVEGEKDVHALGARGLHATTRLGSAKEWVDELSAALAKLGASQVVVIEDRDRDGKQAGAKKAANACESLRRVFPADVPVKRILLPPVVNRYRVKDAADFFAAGGTRLALKALVDAAPSVPTWLDEFAPRLDVLLADPELLRPPAVIVPYLAWEGRVTLLAAGWKAGKSTIVAQAVAACTNGERFLGEATTQSRVLWFALDESNADLAQRLVRLGVAADKVRVTREIPTADTLRRAVADFRPTLVVVDALSDVLQGAGIDENTPMAGQHLRSLCVELAYESRVAFIVIHHQPNTAKRPRGSGSIPAKADVIVSFSKPGRQKGHDGDGGEDEGDDSDPAAPEPRIMKAKGRANINYGLKLHFDGDRYSVEKSPATDPLRALHVLLSHPDGLSANAVVSLLGSQRPRVLAILQEHEAAGYVQRIGKASASRLVITEAGRTFVMGQHPDLAGMHFPSLCGSVPGIGSGDQPHDTNREPMHETENPGSVPDTSPGTSREPSGNQAEPTTGTDCDLFGSVEVDRFPPRTPRGTTREPISDTDLTPIDWPDDDDTEAAA